MTASASDALDVCNGHIRGPHARLLALLIAVSVKSFSSIRRASYAYRTMSDDGHPRARNKQANLPPVRSPIEGVR